MLTVKRDCYAAAEILSKACEKSSEIYGELSEHCGELYYLYGCSMLECGKSENNVLGEGMKNKESEEAEGDEEEEEEICDGEDNQEEKSEAMEVDESEEVASSAGTSNGAVKDDKEEGDDTTKDEEDEDSSLKVAWEMFELAKVVFDRSGNKEKLADTFMKLGEVGIESGHPEAMEDMLKALDVRQQLHPNSRIIAETHFNVGLGYSMFEMFDEAITHFEKSKSLLEEIIVNLEKAGDDKSINEAKEIKGVIPDLKDKIQDMVDSKRDKRREMEETINGNILAAAKQNGSSSAGTSSEGDKPASNITHLIKRKRKIDEVTSDLPSKTTEEPKRKVKALDKVAVDEQESDSTTEQQKKREQISSTLEEPMEMEQAKTTNENAVNEPPKSQDLLTTDSKKSDSESDKISNSMDCESVQSTEKEEDMKETSEHVSEKVTEHEEKRVHLSNLEEKEVKTEIITEAVGINVPKKDIQSSIPNTNDEKTAKETCIREESNNDSEKCVNAAAQDCTNEKNTLIEEKPVIAKETLLKGTSEKEISNATPTEEKTDPDSSQTPKGLEKTDSVSESNEVKSNSNEETTTGIITQIRNESEQKEETQTTELGISETKEMNAMSTDIAEVEIDVKTKSDSKEMKGEAEMDKKAVDDFTDPEKRVCTESSEMEILNNQSSIDSMKKETSTKETQESNESKEMAAETSASEIKHEPMEPSASDKEVETCEVSDSQAKNETTSLPNSGEKAVIESKIRADETETKCAEVKSDLISPKVTLETTVNEASKKPSEVLEAESSSETSKSKAEEVVTETSESNETENVNPESKPVIDQPSSAKSVEDENLNGTDESQSVNTKSSKPSSEEKSVTNGCKEDHTVEEIKTIIDAPVLAKEIGKEEIATTVAAE